MQEYAIKDTVFMKDRNVPEEASGDNAGAAEESSAAIGAEGLDNTAEGMDNTAKGMGNTAEGMDNTAKGMGNTAEGMGNTAEGMDNTAKANEPGIAAVDEHVTAAVDEPGTAADTEDSYASQGSVNPAASDEEEAAESTEETVDSQKNAEDEGEVVYEDTFEIVSDADEFMRIYDEKVRGMIGWSDMVEVFGAVNEDEKVRRQIYDRLQQSVDDVGAYLETQVINARYQGYSWIKEYVIPRLRGLAPKKVIIQFKPFKQPLDDNPEAVRWADPENRFVRELDGIEDVISEKLNINKENIIFEEYTGKYDWTYLVYSETAKGRRTSAGALKVVYEERPFIGGYPELGLAHPSTGFIQSSSNNISLAEQNIKTDLEQVWGYFANEILPRYAGCLEEDAGTRLRLELSMKTPGSDSAGGSLTAMGLEQIAKDMLSAGEIYLKKCGFLAEDGTVEESGMIKTVISDKHDKACFTAKMIRKA